MYEIEKCIGIEEKEHVYESFVKSLTVPNFPDNFYYLQFFFQEERKVYADFSYPPKLLRTGFWRRWRKD